MGVFETIADRRIREARAEGLFDDLPGKGKPIEDLGVERPSGWWASRVVKTERDKTRREELIEGLRRTTPSLWRLKTETELVDEVLRLNEQIAEYNRRTSYVPIPVFELPVMRRRWRETRSFR